MATRSALNGLINGFLTILVTIAKVKNSLSAMNDTYYGQPVDVTTATNDILDAENASQINYNFRFTKQGGQIVLDGEFRNVVGVMLNNPIIAQFKNSEYLPETNFTWYGEATDPTIPSTVPIIVTTGTSGDIYIRVVGQLQTASGGVSYHKIRKPIIFNAAG